MCQSRCSGFWRSIPLYLDVRLSSRASFCCTASGSSLSWAFSFPFSVGDFSSPSSFLASLCSPSLAVAVASPSSFTGLGVAVLEMSDPSSPITNSSGSGALAMAPSPSGTLSRLPAFLAGESVLPLPRRGPALLEDRLGAVAAPCCAPPCRACSSAILPSRKLSMLKFLIRCSCEVWGQYAILPCMNRAYRLASANGSTYLEHDCVSSCLLVQSAERIAV